MKKNYASPEIRIHFVVPAKCILASGENLRTSNFGDEEGEDATCFWD